MMRVLKIFQDPESFVFKLRDKVRNIVQVAVKKEWVLKIMQQCLSNNIPFFFKQWGGVNKKKHGRLLDGKEWNQLPDLSNSVPLVTAV